jgi:hypothetical protein
MFAYLIVGVELALIYAVFWYVFVRDPQPNLDLDKNAAWGGCARNAGTFTAYGAQETLFGTSTSQATGRPISKYAPCDPLESSHPFQVASKKSSRPHSKTECSCSLATSRKRAKTPFSSRKCSKNSEGSFVERICLYLGRKLIQFSIRIS